MSRFSRFTPELREAVREQYINGALIRWLAAQQETSRATISKIVKDLAPKRNHNPNRRIPGKPRLVLEINGRTVRMTETQKFFYDTLLNSCCVDCGETNIVVLDFDHKDPSAKLKSVSHLKGCYDNIALVRAEMDKCEIRCVKCHRIKTAKEHGWISYDLQQARNRS